MTTTGKPGVFPTPPGQKDVMKSSDAVIDQTPNVKTIPIDGSIAVPQTPVIPEPILQIPKPPEESLADAIDKSDAVAADAMCPRCGWDTRQKDLIELTERDKTDFVMAVLSSERFRRTYPLLGGKLVIGLRSRTYAEMEYIGRQLTAWRKKRDIQSAHELLVKMWTFNMLASLEVIKMQGKPDQVFEPFNLEQDKAVTADGELYLEMVERQVLSITKEYMYSMCQAVSRHFDQVMHKLIAQANNPDFWQGIATPA